MKPLLLAIALIAPHSLHAEGSAVLGKIGDIELKTTELRETLAGLDPAQQAAIAKDPSALGPYVRAFLVRQMVLQKAVDEKYDQKPAVIARLVRAREAALAESYLESVSEPDPAYPSEAEIKRAYDDNKEKLVVPRSYRLAQIFISGGKESQARLDAVMKKLKAKDGDFAAIARSASDEQASAAQGGEIGWLTEAQIQERSSVAQPWLRAIWLTASRAASKSWPEPGLMSNSVTA